METRFCPKCLSEFYSSVEMCSECQIPLLKTRPDDLNGADAIHGGNQGPEFLEVISTFNTGDIALLRSVLDAYSVDYYVLGENLSFLEAFAEPTRFFVNVRDVPRVRELLEEVSLTYCGISTTKPYLRDDD